MNSTINRVAAVHTVEPKTAPEIDIVRLMGDLAHELVNPLNAAAMSTELAKLMLSRGQYDKASDALDRICDECMRCARILRDAQDYLIATIDELQHGIDPVKILDDAARMLDDRGEISMDPAPTDLRVEGDPIALRRMFTELLRNAFDYGANRVVMYATRGNAAVEIRIADDGPGIDPVQLPRIFEPFFSTRRDRHSGVGLATARRIAQAHGGSLCAESSQDGSIFTVKLPT